MSIRGGTCVYVLTCKHLDENTDAVISVFDKPNTAKAWLKRVYGWETKHKWLKTPTGQRLLWAGKLCYTLTEYELCTKTKTRDGNDSTSS